MATVTKEVRFYDTVVVYAAKDGEPEKTMTVSATFWSKLLDKVEALQDPKERTAKIRQRQYYGVVVRPESPAINHLQVGRIRDLSEHIEETDLDTGKVEPLILGPSKRVSEPTFVVPFVNSSRVAVMSPGRATRPETIGYWLTNVLDLAKKGASVVLRPIVDENALEKLLASEGAVGVEFHLDAAHELPGDTDMGLLDAVETLRAEGPDSGTLMIGWSLGYQGGTQKDKGMLKNLAAKIRAGNLARRIKVNMVVEQEDGSLRHEQHDLIVDKIVKKATWPVDPDKHSETSDVLKGISKAIVEFNNTPGV